MFLLSFWVLVFLVWICLWFLRIFLQFRPGSAFPKILLMSGLVFLSRSLCLRVWVDDVFCVVSLLSLFLFEEIELRANRTPHTPPARVVVFLFFFFCPRRFVLFACFGRASFLFWGFFGVPFWAPRVFWILSGLL